ncbi:hypothetical protein D5F01_LYC25281 [Larimichthys crocea]|uniref:Uncharacterized protein n=1 Tax=Larimichthys crocea TaxID=215358 RepID=A0A6G0HCP9_LARCR|nr:hypothetical protein D5F01_LYC25281 [Larimichthys crocea]
MGHLRPSSLHPSLGRAGSREPPSGWRSQGPDHSHTTHARTHRQTQRKQGGPDMVTSGPAACTHRWAELAPESLPPAGGHRGLITVTLHTHAHTGRRRGPDMGHLRPSSLHPSLGRAWLQRASLRLEAQQPAPIAGQSLAPESLPPAGGHRGLITVTLHTHAHTGRHRGSRRGALTWSPQAQQPAPIAGQSLAPESLPPAGGHRGLITVTLHTHATHTGRRRGALTWITSGPAACTHRWAEPGSREPPSGWRSQGPDHSHTTHARTHRQTQRKQEGALTWITSGPAACTHRWAEPGSREPPSGWRSQGPDHSHTTHARTQADTEEAGEGALTWITSGPAACTHRWAEPGSREPPSGWRSQGPDHSHTTHARTHRQTQRKQEGALTWITSGPAACTHRWAELAPESLPPAGGHRGLITVTLHTHAHTGRRRGALTWVTSGPAACTHRWAEPGSREPPSGWRSQGPDHSHTTHARTHRQTQGSPDMDHLRPSSLHPSLGRAGSREPPSGWRSQGPDHSHTTHARTHAQTQRKQEGGPDMDHLRPSSLHPSLGRAWLQRASLRLEVTGA